MGDYWHWKDFAIGKDIAFYGIVFHTIDCDLFTRVSKFLPSSKNYICTRGYDNSNRITYLCNFS